MPIDKLLTIAEVAYAIDESERTIRRWVDDGVLPVERVGPYRRIRVRWSTLSTFYPADALRTPTHDSAA